MNKRAIIASDFTRVRIRPYLYVKHERTGELKPFVDVVWVLHNREEYIELRYLSGGLDRDCFINLAYDSIKDFRQDPNAPKDGFPHGFLRLLCVVTLHGNKADTTPLDWPEAQQLTLKQEGKIPWR